MAEIYNPPVAGRNQGEDNEQRIDGDGQEVNALRFLGAGAPPAVPPPAITPVSSGVSQPLQTQQQPSNIQQQSQTPHPPPQSSQHSQQPMANPTGFDYNDPSSYGSMQMPSVPMTAPYGMPGQVQGMMGGAPMMMMPPYNYMYPSHFMYGPYPSMPSAPSNQSQLLAMLNVIRVKDPKFYREWYKKYTAHKRNPDQVPFPQIPGYPVTHGPASSQILSNYGSGRMRKDSSRSINGSINGDPFRHPPNDSFANLDFSVIPGAAMNASMSHAYSRSQDHHRQQPHSGRTSVNEDCRPPPEDEFEIDGAEGSLISIGGNGLLSSTQYHPGDSDRPQTQSGRSSTVCEPYGFQPGDGYGGYSEQPESLGYDSYNRFQPIPEQVREPSPRRMTPMKFSTFHCIATISPLGHLVRIKNSGTTMEFLKLKQFVGHLPEYKEMESFPGPLTPESTHKSTVIEFCQRKIKEARSNTAQQDRKNYILLWEFLILMLGQNGMVVGSDVADLLLKTAEEEEKLAAEVEEVRDDIEGGDGEEEIEEQQEETEETPIVEPPPEVNARDEEKLVKEFCKHLLHGHKKAALDYAMNNDLWGYALFFASKMDDKSYGRVLARFANGIAVNSPLQTLYHVMCGKQPASVTSCADESFGDWKPHLAMLLSNSGYKPEVEHKAILTLGDTLISKNHLFAAQLCYLMGHEQFHKDSRLGKLLGYSSSVDNVLEATQMTEVYEFARKLADPNFSLGVSFLQSKLDYAKSLVSYGFVQDALSYCEEITKTLKAEKVDSAELAVCASTLQIAERIAVADESGTANTTWVEDLRKIISDPLIFCTDSLRKLSLVSSSHEHGSDQMSVASQPYQQQQQQQPLTTPKQEIYDPYVYQNNMNMTSQDANGASSISQSQFGTAVSSATMSTSDPDNTFSGIAEIPPENNWNNANQMNGGLHLSAAPNNYDMNQQQSLQQLPMNSIGSVGLHNTTGNTGNFPTMPSGYPPNMGPEKLTNPAPATNNNNYWYHPYDSTPAVPSNENPTALNDYGQSNSATKKKSVRFEDEHEQHADVESIGSSNDLGFSVRARHVHRRSSSDDLKSAMKCAGDNVGQNVIVSNQQKQEGFPHDEKSGESKLSETGRFSPESGRIIRGEKDSGDRSLVEVEYKSTYPIDEPVETVLNSVGRGGTGSGSLKMRPTALLQFSSSTPFEHGNHKNSKTFPVDKECCDVNEPCEDHDYLGEDEEGGDEQRFPNGVHSLSSQFTGYDNKTENLTRHQPASSPAPSKTNKGGDKKPGKSKQNENSHQPGWFDRVLGTLSLKPKNQMKLPDDKNPAIVWDDKLKRWVNTTSDGEDDLAPAGPPPKDSDLMGLGKSSNPNPAPNGPMSLPSNFNPQTIPPSANNNPAYQHQQQSLPGGLGNNITAPAPVGPYDGAPHFQNGQAQNNQQHAHNQGMPMMMNISHQQQQSQQPGPTNNGMQIPGMPPNNNSMNKYKLQKGRSLKNSYVDVLKPNGARSPGSEVPTPALPIGNMSAPQVPNLFIPPSMPSNQPSDGPVSFLTAPSEDVPGMDQDNSSLPQAPPMFNPAQFQGYPPGQ